MPLAMRSYKPSTTTMLVLEDLERMSSSAVYSGESSVGVDLLATVEFHHGDTPGCPITQYDLSLTATDNEFAAVSLDSTRHALHETIHTDRASVISTSVIAYADNVTSSFEVRILLDGAVILSFPG